MAIFDFRFLICDLKNAREQLVRANQKSKIANQKSL